MKVNWEELLKQAQNGPDGQFRGTVEITMAEELAFGFFMNPMDVVIIKDTENRVWVINETSGNDGEHRGLVSRYNVRKGMVFRLQVSDKGTKVFCITPEKIAAGVV